MKIQKIITDLKKQTKYPQKKLLSGHLSKVKLRIKSALLPGLIHYLFIFSGSLLFFLVKNHTCSRKRNHFSRAFVSKKSMCWMQLVEISSSGWRQHMVTLSLSRINKVRPTLLFSFSCAPGISLSKITWVSKQHQVLFAFEQET